MLLYINKFNIKNKQIIKAAKKTLDERGFGMSSVRFICGTQVKINHYLTKIIYFF